MPSKSEIQRRKAIVQETVRRERAEAEARMPISKTHLAELFDHLDVALGSGCDHTLRLTRAFCKAVGFRKVQLFRGSESTAAIATVRSSATLKRLGPSHDGVAA